LLGISIPASSIFVLSANQSQAYVSSGTTSIIINLCPALVLIYGIVFLEEKLTIKKAVGFPLGFLGGILFLYNSLKSNIGPHVGLGILLSAIAMIAWAGYTITLHYLEGANRVAVLSIQLNRLVSVDCSILGDLYDDIATGIHVRHLVNTGGLVLRRRFFRCCLYSLFQND
jgi:drug/metabolite transporter (DMT)-like permease